MPYSARVLLDSISPAQKRITTLEVTLPRFVLSELNTHRSLSKNSASSRAVPIEKLIKRALEDPAMPVFWGANQSGMSAAREIDDPKAALAAWLDARDSAVKHAKSLRDIGLHKQIADRVLEPFLFHTVILTATEFSNFYALRCAPDAQPEIRHAALLMCEAMDNSTPTSLSEYQWHTPMVLPEEYAQLDLDTRKKVSVARCARVSYLTHDSHVVDIDKDVRLFDRLVADGHMSPTEHQARPLPDPAAWSGNFCGWEQLRKSIPGECR